MRVWAEASSPEMFALWLTMPAVHAASEPEAKARVLADINAAHGGVREYVRSLGVGAAALAELADALLI